MSTASHDSTRPKVDPETFIAVLWTVTALSLLLLIFRLVVRLSLFKHLYADDGLVIFSWLLLLVNSVFLQIEYKTMYRVYRLAAGEEILTPTFAAELERLEKTQAAFWILFYSGLWGVSLVVLLASGGSMEK